MQTDNAISHGSKSQTVVKINWIYSVSVEPLRIELL